MSSIARNAPSSCSGPAASVPWNVGNASTATSSRLYAAIHSSQSRQIEQRSHLYLSGISSRVRRVPGSGRKVSTWGIRRSYRVNNSAHHSLGVGGFGVGRLGVGGWELGVESAQNQIHERSIVHLEPCAAARPSQRLGKRLGQRHSLAYSWFHDFPEFRRVRGGKEHPRCARALGQTLLKREPGDGSVRVE